MRHQRQTLFGFENGNCWATCIACILDMAVEDVPNFAEMEGDWIAHTNAWLGKRGLCLIDIELGEGGSLRDVCALHNGLPCIVSGKSPRGDASHAVVGRYCIENGTHKLGLVHDPHPSDDFFDGPPTNVSFFLTTRPEARP